MQTDNFSRLVLLKFGPKRVSKFMYSVTHSLTFCNESKEYPILFAANSPFIISSNRIVCTVIAIVFGALTHERGVIPSQQTNYLSDSDLSRNFRQNLETI